MFCFLDWAPKGSELGLRRAAVQWRSQGGKSSRLVAAKGLQWFGILCVSALDLDSFACVAVWAAARLGLISQKCCRRASGQRCKLERAADPEAR